ncbi:MAG TPA: hypothetical protein VGP05_07005 [Pseudonocardia sp.]|nr:hypothetical protein [Pseudonocardia sp.]
MLTPADEFPIHQTPEPIAYAGSAPAARTGAPVNFAEFNHTRLPDMINSRWG